uniref:COP9 signalosome complex subunit 9 n=1 Tax=Scophthalmus maximus TaxID=52904 RepID=A0A8D3EES9_SCOMX
MKPAVDEMFPEGAGPYVDLDEAGGSTGLLMDLAANEKAVHCDFFNGKDFSTYFELLVHLPSHPTSPDSQKCLKLNLNQIKMFGQCLGIEIQMYLK